MELINIGSVANDGTGDDLRDAFIKVNNNFTKLDDIISTTAENIGTSGEGIYSHKVNNTLQLKKIKGEDVITVTSTDTNVIIGTDFTGSVLTGIDSITTTGPISAGTYFFGNLQGHVTGDVTGTVYAPVGRVAAQGNVVGQNGLIINISDPNYKPATVDGIAVLEFYKQYMTFDFGSIVPGVFTNPITYLISEIGFDAGTITNPAFNSVDAGAFI